MKWMICWLSVFIFSIPGLCQSPSIQSLEKNLPASQDTARIYLLVQLSDGLAIGEKVATKDELAKARLYARQAVSESEKLNDSVWKGKSLAALARVIFYSYKYDGNFATALDTFVAALPYLRNPKEAAELGDCMSYIGNSYHLLGRIPEGIPYLDTANQIFEKLKLISQQVYTMATYGHCYFDMGDYHNAYEIGMRAVILSDSGAGIPQKIYALTHIQNLYLASGLPEICLEYFHRVLKIKPTYNFPLLNWNLAIGGEAYLRLGELDSAVYISKMIVYDTSDFYSMSFYGKFFAYQHEPAKAIPCMNFAYNQAIKLGHTIGIAQDAIDLGNVYLQQHRWNEAKKYATIAMDKAKSIHALLEMQKSAKLFTDIYNNSGDFKEGYKFGQLLRSLDDSVAPEDFKRRLFLVRVQDELDKQKQESILLQQANKINEQQLKQSTIQRNALIGGLLLLLAIAVIIIRNNRQRKIANRLLKVEKEKVEETLDELKSTQVQLIQSEKMASLGELTAGIAHEIQNPLNFVNNFSEVNLELIDELREQVSDGNLAETNELFDTLRDNEIKIIHHGKRADSIVKNMLQHSRSSSVQKEMTNVNELTDEYLRLSYHGFRAKEKNFNVAIRTDFDPSIGEVKVIRQDLGRLLLNIFSNAFYAVSAKKKSYQGEYEPLVSVTTKKENSFIRIIIRDNGDGIAEKIITKIFQPFFTTKPTGQGTGLGLSLSYDIVKAHGGDLKVNTRVGEFSEFVVQLPV